MQESLLKTILFTITTIILTITPTTIVRTILLFIDVSIYWIRSIYRRISEANTTTHRLKRRLKTATSATEYSLVAFELDNLIGNSVWKDNIVSRRYDYKLIRDRVYAMREVRICGDVQRVLSLLRASLLRNFGGISELALYDRTFIGTKVLIEEYNYEMKCCVKSIDESFKISIQDKLDFFHDAKTTLGCTALCLYGGSLFGMTHVGVVEGLIECELLPNVIVGSGVGSGVAAIVCINKWVDFKGLNYDKTKLLRKGLTIETYCYLLNVIENVGDLTFKEAFEISRRVLNILVYPNNKRVPRLLNYLTTPYVSIKNAIICSMGTGVLKDECFIEGFEKCEFYQPFEVIEDIKFSRITELFNVNHFIISHSRPYLKPLFLPRFKILSRLISLEIKYWLKIINYLQIFSINKWILIDDDKFNNLMIVPQGNRWIIYEIIELLRSEGNSKYWIECGRRSIYEKRTLLETRMRIEFILNDYYEKYRNK
ncbi:hypothetical protein CANINC_001423 [Pichia inconspicua]|uniref:PNPLA domain-containing protein n=1 Tax=Pichia inconspicua TaxID=52247 RepID=A0A4T0X4R0_9ASCO|nr:hypothetical protein CANINC_001423 [[Candida] inconspicua]